MPQSFDGKLNYRAWDEEPPVWSYLGPFASHAEALTQQALTPMFMTSEEITESVRPPLSQVRLFRPRDGYPDYQSRQATVQDIVGVSRRLMTPASSWYSGGPAGYTGSPRYMSNSIGLA